MGEPARQFMSQWTYDCTQDRDEYPLQQLSAECRSIDRVAHRYHQPEPDVHNLHQHDWKEIDIDDDRLLSMARASVSARQRPRSAQRSDIRHEYHSTREYGSDRNRQQASDRRQRIRPRSALSHRPDIEEDQQRQVTRPQSAKPGREHIDHNDFVQSLPQYLKDSKWTAMMQRGQSFRHPNLRRLEQETMELLQSVFRLEQPEHYQHQNSTPVGRKSNQPMVACGSGLQLARTKKSQHQNTPGSENEDSASSSKAKERQRVREKTKRRTKRKIDPGYMKQTECHVHRLEERLGATKKPSPSKKPSLKKQPRPTIGINAANADPSRERVLLEMGWLFGDTPELKRHDNAKPLKTRTQSDQHAEKNETPSGEAPVIDDSEEYRILAQDNEPSPQTRQRQGAPDLNDEGSSLSSINACRSLHTVAIESAFLVRDCVPRPIREASQAHGDGIRYRSDGVELTAATSILSQEFDEQVSECEEDRLIDAIERMETIDKCERTKESMDTEHQILDTESNPSPSRHCNDSFHDENRDAECLDSHPPCSLQHESEPRAANSNADAIDRGICVKEGDAEAQPSDSVVHEYLGIETIPPSTIPQSCEKEEAHMVLYSESAQDDRKSESQCAEENLSLEFHVQTQQSECVHRNIVQSTRPNLENTLSPRDEDDKESLSEHVGKEVPGPAMCTDQDTGLDQSSSKSTLEPHQVIAAELEPNISQLIDVEDFSPDASDQDTPKSGEGWSSSDDGSVSDLMNLCEKLASFPTTPDTSVAVELNSQLEQTENEISPNGSQVESTVSESLGKEGSPLEQLMQEKHLETSDGADVLKLPAASVIDGHLQYIVTDEHCTRENFHLRTEDPFLSTRESERDSFQTHSDCMRYHPQDQATGENEPDTSATSIPFSEISSSHTHENSEEVINSENNYDASRVHIVYSSPEILCMVHQECEITMDIATLGSLEHMNSSLDAKNDEEPIECASDSCEANTNPELSELLQTTSVSSSCATIAVADPLLDVEGIYDAPPIDPVPTIHEALELIQVDFGADADNEAALMEPLVISSTMLEPATMSDDSDDSSNLLVDADEMSTYCAAQEPGEQEESVQRDRGLIMLPRIPLLDLIKITNTGPSESVPPTHAETKPKDEIGHGNSSGTVSVDFAAEVPPVATNCDDGASNVSDAAESSNQSPFVETSSPSIRNNADTLSILDQQSVYSDHDVPVVSLAESPSSPNSNSAQVQEVSFEQDHRMAERIQKQYRCFVNRRLLMEQSKFLATKNQRQSRKKSRLEAKQHSLTSAPAEPSPPCLPVIQEPIVSVEDARDPESLSLGTMVNKFESHVESEELIKLDYASDDEEVSMEVGNPGVVLIDETIPKTELPSVENEYLNEAFYTDSQADTEIPNIVQLKVNRLSLSLAAMAFDDADETAPFDAVNGVYDPYDPYTSSPSYASTFTDSLLVGSTWERYIDEATNKSFYYHPRLQISQWTPPDEPFVDRSSPSQQIEILSTEEADLHQNALSDAGTIEESDNSWSLRRNRSVSAAKWGDWQAFVDESTQHTFYYNAKTQESSWELPVGFQYEGSQEPTVQSEWVLYMDEASGAAYYVNMETNETTWENPFEYAAAQYPERGTREEDDYLIALDENSTEFYELG